MKDIRRRRPAEDITVSAADQTFRFEASRRIWRRVPDLCAAQLVRDFPETFEVIASGSGPDGHEETK